MAKTPLLARLPYFAAALLLCCYFVSCHQANAPVQEPKPDDNRFTKVVLTEGMDEPMQFSFLDKGRVLIIERKGGVKILDLNTHQIKLVAKLAVNTKYTSKEGRVSEAEEGLVGMTVHPRYSENHWIYLYYADPDKPAHILTRWELHEDSLYPATKKVVLDIPTQREVCCHTGGGMTWDKDENLYLTVGNNTFNPANGTSSMDERPGRESFDDQRGSGNTNDLHGKILRIHPEPDGSYTIPEGNLFPKGTAKTRPEIYVMGDRNPWRVSIDSKTGYLYWGEVGPDANVDSVWGSRGYDEFNQARKAGNFGWPYFIGDNRPYVKFNPATNTYGERFDPAHPVNNSPNNTGLQELPPPQKPMIWYPYATSDTFPMLGSSGRSATGGPVFHRSDFPNALRPWPGYFEGKWIITDFMRGWLMAVTMDEDYNYKSMERILPNENFSSAIDIKFSPDGDLYFLEYGSAWFRGNANSALVRIEYNGGNRKPVVEAAAEKLAGAVPFSVKLSSKGTLDYDDYDQGKLTYQWKLSGSGQPVKTSADPNPTFVLDQPGAYTATLTVTDTKGDSNSKTLALSAGNEPPQVSLALLKGNQTFFFAGHPVAYKISVEDKEDGSTEKGTIPTSRVAVNFDYVPEGFDPVQVAQRQATSDEKAGFSAGLYLINSLDCKTCHQIATASVGPAYTEVSKKYLHDAAAQERLANKVISGGGGVWGEREMAAHPNVTKAQANYMVSYILSLAHPISGTQTLPLQGTFATKVPAGENGKGGYLLRAAYKDNGSGSAATLLGESVVVLRNPTLDPVNADEKKGTQLLITPNRSFFMTGDGSYVAFHNIDLSGIDSIRFSASITPNNGSIGGVIEVHQDSPDGPLLGQSETLVPKAIDFQQIIEIMGGGNKNKGKPGAPGAAAPKGKPAAAPAGKGGPGGPGAPAKKGAGGGGGAAGFNFDLLADLMSSHATVAVKPTEGRHNIYVVCRNSHASSNSILLDLRSLTFMQAAKK